MERFSYLLKSRDKALGVFHKAHRKLHEAIAQIEAEGSACVARVREHQAHVASELEAAGFLASEADKAKAQAAKLGDILGL